MTANEFIHWLRGFVDYQQLQGNQNPAFNTIKKNLNEINDVVPGKSYTIKASDALNVTNSPNFEGNSTATYNTDIPTTPTK